MDKKIKVVHQTAEQRRIQYDDEVCYHCKFFKSEDGEDSLFGSCWFSAPSMDGQPEVDDEDLCGSFVSVYGDMG